MWERDALPFSKVFMSLWKQRKRDVLSDHRSRSQGGWMQMCFTVFKEPGLSPAGVQRFHGAEECVQEVGTYLLQSFSFASPFSHKTQLLFSFIWIPSACRVVVASPSFCPHVALILHSPEHGDLPVAAADWLAAALPAERTADPLESQSHLFTFSTHMHLYFVFSFQRVLRVVGVLIIWFSSMFAFFCTGRPADRFTLFMSTLCLKDWFFFIWSYQSFFLLTLVLVFVTRVLCTL